LLDAHPDSHSAPQIRTGSPPALDLADITQKRLSGRVVEEPNGLQPLGDKEVDITFLRLYGNFLAG
jgi:hypothetical protein